MERLKEKTIGRSKINAFYVFSKASKIAFKLIFIPILLLFFGLFADKTLNTTPLFLAVSFLAGLFFALYKAKKIENSIK